MTAWNAPRITRALRLVVVNSVFMAHLVPPRLRAALMRAVGYEVGRSRLLSQSIVRCTTMRIGDGSFVNHRCYFDSGDVVIGDRVYVSTGVTFAMGDHEIGDRLQRAGRDHDRPITVGDGSWIGAGAVLLSGVTIAPGCIVGAGAVVTRDTEPDGVYVGVPARRIRTLP